jgi:hypothetical protein
MSNESEEKATGGYQAFRRRLDAVLRQKDPAALRAFLLAEGQWQADAQTDVDAALWMMIATSPALADLHNEAREWLLAHGHAEEVQAIFGGRARQGGQQGRPQRPPQRGGSRGGHNGRAPHQFKDGRHPRR